MESKKIKNIIFYSVCLIILLVAVFSQPLAQSLESIYILLPFLVAMSIVLVIVTLRKKAESQD